MKRSFDQASIHRRAVPLAASAVKMKTMLFAFCFFAVTLLNAQMPQNGPPLAFQSVCWQFKDLNGNSVAQTNSGEEWWYDFKPVYDASGTQYGYITCGFASYKNLNNVYADGSCNEDGEPDYGNCDENTGELRTDNWYAGPTTLQSISLYNLNGKMVWNKVYNPGEFQHIIQAPDKSGFLAVGVSRDTKDRTQQEYNWTGTSDGFVRYNPKIGQPEFTLDGQETSEPCDLFDPGQKPANMFMVTKVDNDGNVQWSYVYGYLEQSAFALNYQLLNFHGGHAYDVVGYMSGSNVRYRCVGKYRCHPSTPQTQWFMVDLDANGFMAWKYAPATSPKESMALTVKHFNNGTEDVFYVGGTEEVESGWGSSNGFVSCFTGTTTNTHKWTKMLNQWDGGVNTTSGNYNEVFDIDFDHEDNLLVAAIRNMPHSSLVGGSREGEGTGIVYTVTNATSGTINQERESVNIGMVKAYDLKIDVEPTSDDGIAIVSTKVTDPMSLQEFIDDILSQSHLCPPDYATGCDPAKWNYWNFNSNAYVAKYNLEAGEWDQQWEKNIDAPGQRGGFPGDLKRQECVYSIHEDDDGGLVVCGNTSHNFDDYYLFKIHGECEIEDQALHTPYELDMEYWEPQNEPYENNFELANTNHRTWTNVTAHIKGSLYIPTGKTLTLSNCTLYFADTRRLGIDTKIVVTGGGKLEIKNNTLLTANTACAGSMWEGIIVIGNPNSTDPDQQGLVVMNSGSKIEHAINAIQLGNATYSNLAGWQGGGILKAEDATFENNRRDVIFYPHHISRKSASSPSYIRDCSFRCTDPLRDPQYTMKGTTQRVGTNIHVTLWDVHGVDIQGCTFENTSSLPEFVWPTGISSLDATYSLNCESKNAWGCTSAANTFSGLRYGVVAEATDYLSAPSIVGNIFSNISVTGIYMKGISYADIVDNDFTLDWGPALYAEGEALTLFDCPQCGTNTRAIYLYDCNHYLVEGNTMTGAPPLLGVFIGTGIEIYNSNATTNATVENEINNNTFTQLSYGSFGNKYNRGNGNGNSGLDFRCGDYYDCAYDILTTIGPGISPQQGSDIAYNHSAPAGNRFDGCLTYEGELDNSSGEFYEYNFHGVNNGQTVQPAAGCYDPGIYSGKVSLDLVVGAEFSKSVSCPSSFNYVGRMSSASGEYTLSDNNYSNQLIVYNNTIDGGNTQHLLDVVIQDQDDASINAAYGPASPYVSDEALLALISNKPTPFEETQLVNLLVNNSPLTQTVMDAVRNRVPAISPGPMETLEAAQQGTSARFILEQELAYARSEKRMAKDEYIRALIQEYDQPMRMDDIIALLNDEQDNTSIAELATANIIAGNTSVAQTHINTLRTNPDWADYADHLQNLLVWQSDSIGFDTILRDPDLYAQVLVWAGDENSTANMPARVMLEFLHEVLVEGSGEFTIEEISVYPSSGPAGRYQAPGDESENGEQPAEGFSAYPNPFTDQIDFNVDGSEGSYVIIRDVRGAELVRLPVIRGQHIVSWDSRTTAPGIYFATLVEQEKPARSVKIIKY